VFDAVAKEIFKQLFASAVVSAEVDVVHNRNRGLGGRNLIPALPGNTFQMYRCHRRDLLPGSSKGEHVVDDLFHAGEVAFDRLKVVVVHHVDVAFGHGEWIPEIVTDDVGELLESFFFASELLFLSVSFNRVADRPVQEFPVHIVFDQVILCTPLNRLNRRLLVFKPGKNNNWHPVDIVTVAYLLAERVKCLDAGTRRQSKIKQDNVARRGCKVINCGGE
jgi:hypothetical protein